MKAKINNECIGCGLCSDLCPSMFQLTDKIYAIVVNPVVKTEEIDSVNKVVQKCPKSAISLHE